MYYANGNHITKVCLNETFSIIDPIKTFSKEYVFATIKCVHCSIYFFIYQFASWSWFEK